MNFLNIFFLRGCRPRTHECFPRVGAVEIYRTRTLKEIQLNIKFTKSTRLLLQIADILSKIQQLRIVRYLHCNFF